MSANRGSLSDGAHLLFIAKNLERIGDHATNVAEVLHFQITGEEVTGERPKFSLAVSAAEGSA